MGANNWFKGARFKNRQVGLRHGFRSGLEEANAAHLKAHGIPVVFEEVKIKYVVPATERTYTCDFLLPNGVLVESKGLFAAIDRAKHLFVKYAHPTLDIRFVFTNPNARLSKGSKTTYASWCEMHGYKFAKKLIPIEWAKEPRRNGPTGACTIPVPLAAREVLENGPARQARGRRATARDVSPRG